MYVLVLLKGSPPMERSPRMEMDTGALSMAAIHAIIEPDFRGRIFKVRVIQLHSVMLP